MSAASQPRLITGKTTAWLSSFQGPQDLISNDPDKLIARLYFASHDMSTSGWSKVGVATVTLEIPDEKTLIDNKAESIKAEIKKVKAAAQNAITQLTEKLNQLLAISNEASA